MASEHRPRMTDPASSTPRGLAALTVAITAAPAAARARPAIIGSRGPKRAVSRPLANEPAPTATLIGRMSSPVAAADSCRDCCRNSEMQSRDP